jgi:uncharacterized protein (TIGR02444 family)
LATIDAATRDHAAARFWRYCHAVWGRAGAAETCLWLQDRHGLDVNLVLLTCWLAHTGNRSLTDADVAAIEAGVATWRADIIAPLRQARRALTARVEIDDTLARLRQAILAVELDAEKIGQRRMIDVMAERGLLAPAADPAARAAAEAGLKVYLRGKGIAADTELARALDRLLDLALSPDA